MVDIKRVALYKATQDYNMIRILDYINRLHQVNRRFVVLDLTLHLYVGQLCCADSRSDVSFCLSRQVFEILAFSVLLLNAFFVIAKMSISTQLSIIIKQ